jgi:CheY-like chemotaxis protein
MTGEDAAVAPGALGVMAVATDAAVLCVLEQVCAADERPFHFATDVAAALAIASSEQPDLAFVDVSLDGGAGLALVHHLPAVAPSTVIYTIVPPTHLDLWNQARALGAVGVLFAPPSAEGFRLALAEATERRATAREISRLRGELEAWKERSARVERVARLAGRGDRAEIALAFAEGLAEATRASGAAVYVVDGDPERRTRLAAVGSAAMLDARGGLGQSLEGAQLLTLVRERRTVGYAFLDNPAEIEGDAVETLCQIASALLDRG